MFCSKCGSPNPDNVAACARCGAPLVPTQVPVAAPPQQVQAYVAVPVGTQTGTSGMAIAGFVLAFLCSVLGLIFSILGYKECKRSNGTLGGEGLALAGIIISIVGLAIGLIYLLAFSAALGTRL